MIEEENEHDEEERKTGPDNFPKAPGSQAQPLQQNDSRNFNKSGPSTVQGPNLSSNGAASNNIGNSQSRIKVNLS